MGAVEYTQEQLEAHAEPERDPRAVLSEISRRSGVPQAVILGRSRSQTVARARLALYRALREMKMSYPEIGRFVGGRDHSTVIAVMKYAEDPAYREKLKVRAGAHH
jgi:chromosomal replication initiation ATPase DnaA